MTKTRIEPSQHHAYVSLVAQHSNLGDLVLRAEALKAVHRAGIEATALIDGMPDSYVSAIGVPPSTRLISSRREFRTRLMSSRNGPSLLVLSPGPQMVQPGLRGLRISATVLAQVLASRAAGGAVVALGRALDPVPRGVVSSIERMTARATSAYVTRETATAEALRPHALRAPDLAFGVEAGLASPSKEHVALSFRFDSHPALAQVERAAGVIRNAGYEPLMVTQVEADDQFHAQAARAMRCDAVLWEGRSHKAQLERVSRAYARSRAVLSDRLHSLIFGINQGALPIERRRSAESKVARALRGVVTYQSVNESFDGLDEVLEISKSGVARELILTERSLAADLVHKTVDRVLEPYRVR